MPTIHPTALVDPSAQIADTATIGPFATVEADVVIGEGTNVGPHCRVDNGARIGNNVIIHQGAVVATPPQDLKYANEKTEFHIGDNTVIREYATLNRGTTHSYKSVVGRNCLIMAYAHVAHDCLVGDNVIIANAVQMGGHCEIGDFAIIGGGTVIHQFSHVGMHSMTGGGLRVGQDVPPYVLAGRAPAVFEGLNKIGLRRRGFSHEAIDALENAYEIIYRSGRNVSQAVEYIRDNTSVTPEVQTVLDFIAGSNRGIIQAAGKRSRN